MSWQSWTSMPRFKRVNGDLVFFFTCYHWQSDLSVNHSGRLSSNWSIQSLILRKNKINTVERSKSMFLRVLEGKAFQTEAPCFQWLEVSVQWLHSNCTVNSYEGSLIWVIIVSNYRYPNLGGFIDGLPRLFLHSLPRKWSMRCPRTLWSGSLFKSREQKG